MRALLGRSLVLLVCLLTSPALAAMPPMPPCAGPAQPSWPAPGKLPSAMVWHVDDLPAGWMPPACTGLPDRPWTTIVALAGSFREPGGPQAVKARIGAVSRQLQVLYWSVSGRRWMPMLEDAAALSDADPASRRPDFSPTEIRAGAVLHVVYDDANPLGPIIYETDVLAADPDELRLVTRNLTPGRMMGFTVAEPGDLASMVSVQAAGGDLFRYYALATINLAKIAATLVPDASHLNRAAATFRYIAGLPTDQEPPLALR